MTFTLLAVGATVLVLVVLVLGYNALVRKRNAVDNAWAQIDVQLRRRYDLIPNLVSTVKGYTAHERETLEAVTLARTRAQAAVGLGERARAEQALSGALLSLVAVAEAYPVLRADQNFLRLQQELADSENRIAYARQYYNDSVLTFNTAVQTVPANVLAAAVRMRARPYFQTPEEQRGAVPVSFDR